MELSRIDKSVELLKRITFLSLLLSPIVLFLKISCISFLIQLPFLTREIEIKFKYIFRGVTYASFVFIIAALAKIIWIKSIPPEKLSEELMQLIPFALTNILHYTSYSKAAFTFLNNINIFEAFWILVTTKYLAKHSNISLIDSVSVVSGVWFFLALLQFGIMYYLSRIF
jgi:hypothetical protein